MNSVLRNLFIFLFIIFLSGCAHIVESEAEISEESIGIKTSVYANTFPDQVFEGVDFSIQMIAENLGGYTIPVNNYYLFLRGFNPATLNVSSTDIIKSSSNTLESIAVFGNESTIRGQEVFDFSELCYNKQITDKLPITFFLKSCYEYQTTAEASVCFSKTYSAATETPLCTVTGTKSVSNTGAPIQITSISETPAGENKYRFLVILKNNGNGEVFSKYSANTDTSLTQTQILNESMASCNDVAPNNRNIVFIDSIMIDGVEQIGGSNILLEPERVKIVAGFNEAYLNLINGEGRFSFVYTKSDSLEYVSNLVIKVGYGYSAEQQLTTVILDDGLDPTTVLCT